MWNDGNDTVGGGGFLNNTTNNFDSPASKKKSNVKRHQSITPVVIRQIRDNPEDEFQIFGIPTQILEIVGILKTFEITSTKATYNIEDHTGNMKAVWWLENDTDNTQNLPQVKEGCYVQVFGTLRMLDNERVLMVLRMFLVDDANILTTHLLQVINARLQAEHVSKNASASAVANNPGAQLATSMSYYDENMPDNGQHGLTALQQRVLRLLQANTTPSGADREEILNSFPATLRREANDALDFLVNEGHAYSTIDNEHFKSTTF